jgi:1-deoxy-D-xylulose-5-phosphate synthase
MIETLKNVLKLNEPCILHVVTQKGKGYAFAEKQSDKFHSAPPFDISTGQKTISKVKEVGTSTISFTEAFTNSIVTCAEEDEKIVAITAAMPDGTGLTPFQERFPHRFFDVGIAESHAVTFAGALAHDGLKPVCAIYSTFLQRAYDQLIHDIALQGANVTFCLDRAGIVGPDGPTHHGVFDFAFMRSVPASIVGAPCNEYELLQMLRLAKEYRGPFAIRYPKINIPPALVSLASPFDIGKGEPLMTGDDVSILAIGTMVDTALEVAQHLKDNDISASVINMRFVKPLDVQLVLGEARRTGYIITIEEHIRTGGFGSAVVETLSDKRMNDVTVNVFALPDYFIEHGSRDYLLEKYNLTAASIAHTIITNLQECK